MAFLKTDKFAYLLNPNKDIFFSLINGEDLNEVDLYCKNLSKKIAGEDAHKEMRIEKYFYENFKNNFEEIDNSINTLNFFSGIKVIIIKNFPESLSEKFKIILNSNHSNSNTKIIGTAKSLGYKSSLKKFVDNNSNCLNIFLNNKISKEYVKEIIKDLNIKIDDNETLNRLIDHSNDVSISDFRENIKKISLYKLNDENSLKLEEIEEIIFVQHQSEMYEIINFAVEGKLEDLIISLINYNKKINDITTTLIILNKIFLQFHQILSSKKKPEFAINNLKPPIYSKKKDQILSQLKKWNLYKIEKALAILSEADYKIRSTSKNNFKQIFERTFINIAKLTN